ncbi:transposase [Desulfosarcina alkanivorans]|jgi:REP element-mobilizing transposase RayT|uniref:Transposase n=1 Tax=Desulfosarcina alkanivorans TaxID=571177 RepID=A0A5K7YV82_9BACT|nr:transposase [Desulfosarcina alkanivorans]BBO70951.1 transposase [Desulfosarcina alkanivorans]
MPRGARLDTPGTLHHAIVRGIERRRIVDDDPDRENFIRRVAAVARESRTPIYAWALMDNHAHLLMRSGEGGIARFMRRVLTGYALSYNRRHHRHGHLFQNRYKSIVCQEDAYFTELVRYIHLNPLRAGLVDTPSELDRYPWCGHAVVLGLTDHPWQDRDYVLRWFGTHEGAAKRAYRAFVKKGIPRGERPELVGGGLVRSMGGWSAVKSLRSRGVGQKGDARILGSGDFVTRVVGEAGDRIRHQLPGRDLLEAAGAIIRECCTAHNVPIAVLRNGSRRRAVSRIRRQLTLRLVNELGLSLAETGRQLGLTTSGVAQILRRHP